MQKTPVGPESQPFPKIAFDGSPEYDKHVGGAGYCHGTRTPGLVNIATTEITSLA